MVRVLVVASGALLAWSSSCSPVGPRTPAPAAAPAQPELVPFKRVDHWRYLDLETPPTPVEIQLKKHFQAAFAHAQYSEEYTCLTREFASFREQHAAVPDELLEQSMMGRCQVPIVNAWRSIDIYSDGTVLDNPLSPELLQHVATELAKGLPPFTVFGVTARYVGPNALVLLQVANAQASMRVGTADEDGNVRVEGTLVDDFTHVTAIINQGEFGTERCDPDPEVALPRYALNCLMATGDDEAWIAVMANRGGMSWDTPLTYLPAHRPGWTPPAEFRRTRPHLDPHRDTASALLDYLNDARVKLGRRPLAFAREQSSAMQHTYEQMFRKWVSGSWEDQTFRAEMLKGTAIQGPVWWGRVAAGIAFDGDLADWLAYRLFDPVSRETLMMPLADQVSVAAHGDPAFGFGAAAVIYSLFTPERERAFADAVAERIAELRGGRSTQRLEDIPELQQAARAVAEGIDSPEVAFRMALRRLNLAAKTSRRLDGVLLNLPWEELEFDLPAELAEPDVLAHGVVFTHHKYPGDDWSRAVAFVWFVTERTERQAALR